MAELPSKLSLTVVTRERRVIETEADEIVLPAYDGYLGVLPGHTPLLAILKIGEMMYREGTRQNFLVLASGFAEILPARVIVLAEGAHRPEEIDREAAERERIEAERELASLSSNDEGFVVAQAKLEESVAKIQISIRRPE